MRVKELAAVTLIVSLALGALPANAQEKGAVVDGRDIAQALAQKARSDEADRDSIRGLLARDDVKALASDMGLDVRRARGALASLQGKDLQRAAVDARAVDDLLGGNGNGTIQISLVAALLIVIIIILLVD